MIGRRPAFVEGSAPVASHTCAVEYKSASPVSESLKEFYTIRNQLSNFWSCRLSDLLYKCATQRLLTCAMLSIPTQIKPFTYLGGIVLKAVVNFIHT
jgi:hypothetical protein